MAYFRRTEFTAQGKVVWSLFRMYTTIFGAGATKVDRGDIVPVVVFMAFSVEAYLNGIGSRVCTFWEHVERCPWREKVEILHSLAGKSPNWGAEPLQFVRHLFKTRDLLAHGKPESVRSSPYLTAEDAIASEMDEPEWFRKLDREWALRAKERFHEAMIYLGAMHGFGESDHLHSASSSVEVR